MKKVVIIDDDQTYFDRISEYLRYLGFEFYPKYVKEFESFRGNIGCSFSFKDSVAKESLQTVLHKINEFKKGMEEVVYVIDYELSDGNSKINGVDLCSKILPVGFEDKVIIISGTSDRDQLEKINYFIASNSNCYFVAKKQQNFIKVLFDKIIK